MTNDSALSDEPARRDVAELPAWVPRGSSTGALIAERDWSSSGLGPIQDWPKALTDTARLCLDSRFPFAIAWGSDAHQLYNDAFARLCGDKHPSALGQSMRQCWASAWSALGPAFERATAGESAYVEDGRLYLDRGGRLEETFATFSFSPLRASEDAAVAGVLLTIIETTSKVLAERRSSVLRDLATAGVGACSAHEAFTASVQVLDDAASDVPFALLYRVGPGAHEAELAARTRSAPERCCPPRLDLHDPRLLASSWPLGEIVTKNQRCVLPELASRFGPFECGPYPEAPTDAVLLPITLPGAPSPCAVLVAAASARRTLDVAYLDFFERLAASVSSSVAAAHAHEAQQQLAEELSARDRAKSEQAEQLERNNQELEAFSYSVSHDLRAPLHAIDGFSKALLAHKSDQLDDEAKDYLTRVRRAAERMGQLIDELLSLSRVSRAPLHRQTVSLSAMAERVARNLAELAPERRVRCQVDAGLSAFADQRLLQIVVENLLGNSWKFTKREVDARVHVAQLETAEIPTYFVRDNGAGFDQSRAQRLFQPFQRLHLERDYPGTGIGLAIVQRIINRHGGRIWAEGREQQGATFYFTLPDGS